MTQFELYILPLMYKNCQLLRLWGLKGCSFGKAENVSYLQIYDTFWSFFFAVTFCPKNAFPYI